VQLRVVFSPLTQGTEASQHRGQHRRSELVAHVRQWQCTDTRFTGDADTAADESCHTAACAHREVLQLILTQEPCATQGNHEIFTSSAPGDGEVRLHAGPLALQRSNVVGLSRVLLVLVAAQIHLPPQLLDPDVRLPPVGVKHRV
jgi:hypothetical protein